MKVRLFVKLLVEESMERVRSTMLLQVHWFREECEEHTQVKSFAHVVALKKAGV